MANKLVRKGYDNIADVYLSSRDQFKNQKYLSKLNDLLKKKSTILDIGCGAGKPIDEYFINRGHKIIGLDISEKQIRLAKRNFPNQKFEVKNMSELKDEEYQVDAIVSFYAIFHVNRKLHRKLFNTFNSFLPKGGLILATMGAKEWEGTEDNFYGAEMFWSHWGADKNLEIIRNTGFKILEKEIDISGGERHQVVLAKKITDVS